MPSDEVLYRIRQSIDYERFFAEFLPDMRGSGNERRARCIFHEDDNPSMGVNVAEGLYRCHTAACGAQGDFIDFYRRVRDCTFTQAVEELARRCGIETRSTRNVSDATSARTVDDAIVDAAHARLMSTPTALQVMHERRGLNDATLRRYRIGHDGQRFYIPIQNEIGQYVNIRRYKPGAPSHEKMISWREGFGGARIWPFDSIQRAIAERKPIVIVEGEMDCLLANQCGLCAVTATGGAGTWRDAWNIMFADGDVVICYDIDQSGIDGARAVANALHGVAGRVRIVRLPLTEPDNADFTDYIVGHGHGIDDFNALVDASPDFAPNGGAPASSRGTEAVSMHLANASRAEHYNQRIRVAVMVSGKTTAPYLVPKQVRLTCSMPGLPMCAQCPVSRNGGNLLHVLLHEGNEVLQYVGVPDTQVQKRIKASAGVPSRCGIVDCEVVEAMNVEEVQLIPEVDRTDEDSPYVTRGAFYTGHGLAANRSYLMTGVTVPNPHKQTATHIISDAIPSQSNIDAFRLTDDVIRRLRKFQPARPGNVGDLWAKMNEVYMDLETMTRIFQRRDIMLVVDLVFHSLLSFTFQGERLARGWCEALIIGDSRTGKTSIVSRMMQHYAAGEFSSGENTTLAGLVGGLHQIGNSWALQWGRVPLNDRRLLAIDEAGNLPLDQIARMSSMRSSGIAEIIKVHTERTNARTRQLWMSNPRKPNPMSSYSQGVLAVKELIGEPSDVARFDLVVTAASDDVDLSVINAQRVEDRPRVYTTDLCHQRVMWAWSRNASHVVFDPDAEVLALRRASEHGMRYQYTTDIPLCEPNEQRIKIARLATAAATMFFSTDDAGEKVIVRQEHVEFAAQFLGQLYAKPSLAYDEFAQQRKRMNELTNPRIIEEILTRNVHAPRSMMEQEQLQQSDLREILSYDDSAQMRSAITTLRNNGFLRRVGTSYYVKTPAAIRWLRTWLEAHSDEASAYRANGLPASGILQPSYADEPEF